MEKNFFGLCTGDGKLPRFSSKEEVIEFLKKNKSDRFISIWARPEGVSRAIDAEIFLAAGYRGASEAECDAALEALCR